LLVILFTLLGLNYFFEPSDFLHTLTDQKDIK